LSCIFEKRLSSNYLGTLLFPLGGDVLLFFAGPNFVKQYKGDDDMRCVSSILRAWLRSHREARYRVLSSGNQHLLEHWRPPSEELELVKTNFANKCFSSTWHTGRPTILVSACLLGRQVQYHGRTPNKNYVSPQCCGDDLGFLVFTLGMVLGVVQIASVCPEVDIMGLATPRAPMRQLLSGGSASMILRDPLIGDVDVTRCLTDKRNTHIRIYHSAESVELQLVPLDKLHVFVNGAILKAKSPSCGVGDARLYSSSVVCNGKASYELGHGMFVRNFLALAESPCPLVTDRALNGKHLLYDRTLDSTGSTELFLDGVVNHFQAQNKVVRDT
jgi:uncharacterized protein YbbK (DUF523 family)